MGLVPPLVLVGNPWLLANYSVQWTSGKRSKGARARGRRLGEIPGKGGGSLGGGGGAGDRRGMDVWTEPGHG